VSSFEFQDAYSSSRSNCLIDTVYLKLLADSNSIYSDLVDQSCVQAGWKITFVFVVAQQGVELLSNTFAQFAYC